MIGSATVAAPSTRAMDADPVDGIVIEVLGVVVAVPVEVAGTMTHTTATTTVVMTNIIMKKLCYLLPVDMSYATFLNDSNIVYSLLDQQLNSNIVRP